MEGKTMEKLYLELSWDDFCDRYIINHEEFLFHYNDFEITLCWGNKSMFSYNVSHNGVVIDENEYTSPQELLEKAIFFGKRLQDIYEELY